MISYKFYEDLGTTQIWKNWVDTYSIHDWEKAKKLIKQENGNLDTEIQCILFNSEEDCINFILKYS